MAFCLSKNYSYLCYMGNWEKQQDEKKESRERDQSRRENLVNVILIYNNTL